MQQTQRGAIGHQSPVSKFGCGTPRRGSIGMLDLREVPSAFGVEDEFLQQGRRYLRMSCEMDIGIEAGSL